ncbi:MAG TPA: hypothetical protein VI319_03725 [Burkholderiales bacterium]
MQRRTRLALLFTALAGVAAWAAFGGKDAQHAPASVASTAKPSPAAPQPAAASEIPERATLGQMGADPFNTEPPALPAPVVSAPPPAPAKPVAPPMPYRFAGRLHVGNSVEVYLMKGEELVPVKKGDTLDGQYKIEKIGRTEMTLLHLASRTREKIEYDPPIKDDDAVADAPAPEAHAEAQRRSPSGG